MIQKAAVSQDFTFPQVASHSSLYSLQFSGPASSLWHSPSQSQLSNQPNLPKECDLNVDQETHRRRSFSFVEGGTRVFPSPRELELSCNDRAYSDTASVAEFDMEEEKMDMLWEDFHNYDEFTQARLARKKAELSEGTFLGSSVCYELGAERHKLPELYCVEALKISKSSRPGVVAMLKVLKKLFPLHNSHPPRRA